MNNGCTIVAYIEDYEFDFNGWGGVGVDPTAFTTMDQQSTKILLTRSVSASYSHLQKYGITCYFEVCAVNEDNPNPNPCEWIDANFFNNYD